MKKQILISSVILSMAIFSAKAAEVSENSSMADNAIAVEAVVTEYEVKGCVIDSLTHEGEPMATVRIWKSGTAMENDKTAAAGTTDNDGRFSFTLKQKGDYLLLITSIGRSPITRMFSVNRDRQQANLGTLYIAESAQNLDDVVVAIQKPLVKMEGDKIAYSVKDDPDAKTNTVLDMLRKVPMVTVDGDDNIQVNGSSNFQVYLNGKPSAMMSSNPKEVLKAIPAEGVKNIEVLTNPGAKYDAEGVGGILNIITEQQQGMEGYTASISLQGGNRMNGANGYVMVQKDKLTLSVNAHEGYMFSPSVDAYTERDQFSDGQHMSAVTEQKSGSNILFGTIDATYQVNDKNSISFTANVMDMRSKVESEIDSKFSYPQGKNSPMQDFSQSNDNKVNSTLVNGSIDYTHVFGDNSKHTLIAAYRVSTQPRKNVSETEYSLQSMPSFSQEDKNNMLENTLQLDYTLPTAERQMLEAGGKYVWRKGTAESPLLDYTHRNSIGALYTTYSMGLGKVTVKGGLRYEHTEQEVNYSVGNGKDFSLSYDNLVPNLSLSLATSMSQNLNLSYMMRISRPGISVLNPYRNTQNVTNVTYGNPDLDVEKVHNTQLTYSYFSTQLMLNATLRYSYQDNGIEQYSFMEENVLNTTYDNIATRQNSGVSLFASWSITPKTRLTLNGSLTYVDLKAESMNLATNGWQNSFMVNLQQNLPWNMKLSALYMHNGNTYTLQGKNAGMNIHMLGLNKSCMNDRLTISLNAMNPFSPTMHMDVESQGKDYGMSTKTDISMFTLTASVSYRFGDMKMQKKQARTADESDLIEAPEDNMNNLFIQ
ncbi:MAG: TonB-dependent receptor [Bacteroidales bacterium]|nr:TonB-dependent receptor [Bacteroidales bacterium]